MEEHSTVEDIPVLDNKTVDMGAVLQGTDFSEEIEDVDVLSEMVTESVQMCSGQISLASEAANNLMNRKLGSVDYLVSVENYKLITDVLASNLGVKPFVPALEDFGSKFALEASHEVAMEGFLNFIKKMWAKIKSFFLEFFKKVGQFIKRISGANLEIDTYEKYVDDIIRKIKRKQLVLSDNTVKLESRLPSLVADLTTSEFNDYSEVLNKTENKLNRLAYELKSMYDPAKLRNTESSLKDVRGTLDDVLKEAVSSSPDVNLLNDKLSTVIEQLVGVVSAYYLPEDLSSNDVPSEVYENILRVSENVNIANIKIRSMVKPGDGPHSLPKQFNTYLALGVDKGTYIRTSTELNTYVSSKVPPIATIDNMEKFYKTYKEFVKSYNVKDSSNILNRMDKDVTELIGYMESKYSNVVNTVNNTVYVQEKMEPFFGSDTEQQLRYIINFPEKMARNITDKKIREQMFSDMKTLYTPEFGVIMDILRQASEIFASITKASVPFLDSPNYNSYREGEEIIYGLISSEFLKGSDKARVESDLKDPHFLRGFVTYVIWFMQDNKNVANDITANLQAIILKLNKYLEDNLASVGNPSEILEILKTIQESVIPFLNTYKSHVTSVATDLSAIYTETRGAAIKYIYDSARLYH